MHAESYGEARSKLKKAEETSALETDVEDVVKSREKRKKIITDVDDTDEYQIEHQPIRAQKKKTTDDVAVLTTLPIIPSSLLQSSCLAVTNSSQTGSI